MSATSPPPPWSTSSSKPPTSERCPGWSAATAAWTSCCSMSSVTSRSTPGGPSCCSRSSPRGRDEPPSRSGRICRSAKRRLPRPPPGRRDRRPGHLQRAHPRDRHSVLPAPHQQDRQPHQETQLNPHTAHPGAEIHADQWGKQLDDTQASILEPEDPHRRRGGFQLPCSLLFVPSASITSRGLASTVGSTAGTG